MSGVVLSLEGKVALVTGGSRGIGAATVRMFRQAGAQVVFSYEKARQTAESLAAELGGPELCRAMQQPLSTPADGRALVAAAVAAFGRLDCLIVNHGFWPSHDQPIATMPDAQWRSTLSINLDSVFGLVQAAVVQMSTQTDVSEARHGAPGFVKGHIVLIASTAAQRGEAFHADYAASKGALLSLTKSLSSELIGQGVYVNCVAPGWVQMGEEERLASSFAAKTPMGRNASPEDVAAAVLFFATGPRFITGQTLGVDGGLGL